MGEGEYESLTGTSVYRDFVELPSQIMENWATEKEFLDLWAVHYETGEPIPAEIVDRIVAAQNYLAAYANVRQLSFGMTDMAWHTLTEPFDGDVEQFEVASMAPTQVMPVIAGTAMAPARSATSSRAATRRVTTVTSGPRCSRPTLSRSSRRRVFSAARWLRRSATTSFRKAARNTR